MIFLIFIKRWALAAGCEDCSLYSQLWKDWNAGTEETVVGRRSHSLVQTLSRGRSERGRAVGSVPGAVFVLLWR